HLQRAPTAVEPISAHCRIAKTRSLPGEVLGRAPRTVPREHGTALARATSGLRSSWGAETNRRRRPSRQRGSSSMRIISSLVALFVYGSLVGCAAGADQPDEEEAEATSSAVTSTIPGTSLGVVSGYQTNTSILGVPVRAIWSNGQAEASVYLSTGGVHTV